MANDDDDDGSSSRGAANSESMASKAVNETELSSEKGVKPRIIYTSLGRSNNTPTLVPTPPSKQEKKERRPKKAENPDTSLLTEKNEDKRAEKDKPETVSPAGSVISKPKTILKERRPVAKPKPSKDTPKLKAEYDYLKRRFSQRDFDSKIIVDGGFVASFRFPILDPDFPFELETLRLCLTFPGGYPDTERVRFEILDEALPEAVRRRIQNRMADAAEKMPWGEPKIRELLLVLERNLEKWMVVLPTISEGPSSSVKIIKEIVVTPPPPPPPPPSSSLRPVADASISSPNLPKMASPVSIESITKSLELASVGVPVKKAYSRFQPPEFILHTPVSPNVKHGTVMIELQGLCMEGIGLVIPVRLGIAFRCSRCNGTVIADDLGPECDRFIPCNVCGMRIEVTFYREALHSHNSTLGYLRVKRAHVDGLLPSKYQVTCDHCTPSTHDRLSNSLRVEDVQIGEEVSFACRNCHEMLHFGYKSVRWTNIASLASETSTGAKKNEKLPTQIGEPLPKMGTCEHYRKSNRWFRFPCCGRAFPCDECHNAAVTHAPEWAKRQICGFCSREFSTSQKFCLCGETPGEAGKRTAFWQGGKGDRDQMTMSRKDRKKYRNQEKTLSNKAARKKD